MASLESLGKRNLGKSGFRVRTLVLGKPWVRLGWVLGCLVWSGAGEDGSSLENKCKNSGMGFLVASMGQNLGFCVPSELVFFKVPIFPIFCCFFPFSRISGGLQRSYFRDLFLSHLSSFSLRSYPHFPYILIFFFLSPGFFVTSMGQILGLFVAFELIFF